MNLNQPRRHLLLASSLFFLVCLLATVNHSLCQPASRSDDTLHEILTTLRQIQSTLNYQCRYDHVPEFKDQPAIAKPTTVPHYEPQPEGTRIIIGVLVGLGAFAVTMCFFLYTEDMEFIRAQQLLEYWAVAAGMGLLALLVTYHGMIWSQRFLELFFVCYAMAVCAERREERRQRNRRLDV